MYSSLQNTAAAMLKNFGTTVTLTKAMPGSFDPTTGADITAQVHIFEVFAVFVKPRASFGTGGGASFANAIQQGDSIALIAANGGTLVSPPAHYFPEEEAIPEQNDVIDGWTILNVEQVNPAGTVVLYKCHVRKQ